MKIGLRTPSIKKSFSARTSARGTRALKKLVNPGYGKKGVGLLTNPKKAAYNKIYNKTTVSAKKILTTDKKSTTKPKASTTNKTKSIKKVNTKQQEPIRSNHSYTTPTKDIAPTKKKPVRTVWTKEDVSKAKDRLKKVYLFLLLSLIITCLLPFLGFLLFLLSVLAFLYNKGIVWGYQDQEKAASRNKQ